MAFCVNCGQELKEGVKFCANCGSTVIPHKKVVKNERKTFYDGEIHKCPNCGEVINSFIISCPSCGYELRGSSVTSSVSYTHLDVYKRQIYNGRTHYRSKIRLHFLH